VTSRNRLAGLDGAVVLSLDVMPRADSVAMLTRLLDRCPPPESSAAAQLAELCGHLPLALRIAAARLVHRPAWTVEHLVDRLRDRRRRLGELATADTDIVAVLDASYRRLPSDQKRMFRFLALHPGADFDRYSAAALYGTDADTAERLLECLLDGHLLEQRGADRYAFHDLVRAYAVVTAETDKPTDARRRASERLVEYFAQTAATAVDLIATGDRCPGVPPCRPDDLVRRPLPNRPRPTAPAGATVWLSAERQSLALAARSVECRPSGQGTPFSQDLALRGDMEEAATRW
jgi:hypothetical protein